MKIQSWYEYDSDFARQQSNRATEKIYEDKLKLFYTQGNFTELWNFKKKLQLGDRGFFFKDMYKWGTRQIKLSGKGWAKRMIY